MTNNVQIVSTQQMLRTNPAHIGSENVVDALTGTDSLAKSQISNKATGTSFDQYLIDAVNYVNDKQQVSSDMTEKLITDPDSVDVHDITIAMAEANLSLSIAQNVIDRITQSWTKITSAQ